MGMLSGKVAVVTGAARGIGRAVAQRLAADGAAVVINYAANESAAGELVEEIQRAGGEALAVRGDIAMREDIRHLFQRTLERYARLDILVANAGYCAFAPFMEIDEDAFDRMYAVNAKGTFFCMQEALRHMVDGGRIVCVSTIGTVFNGEGGAAYFGSKAAVEQFCRTAAKEVAHRGITINTISPGFIDTDMLRTMLSVSAPGLEGDIVGLTPLSRLGTPNDVAEAVAFLSGPGAAWITRQNLAVDGGIVSR